MASINPVTVRSNDPKEFGNIAESFGTGEVTFSNSGNVIVLLHNTTISPITVTIETPATFDVDLDLDDREVSVPAEDILIIGPFPARLYNDSEQVVTMTTVSEEAELFAAAIFR